MNKTYTREQAQRDLHPHKPAVFAMWLWGARYASGGLGSMGFWDSLTDSERDLCRRAIAQIEAAPAEPIPAGQVLKGQP